MKVGHVNEQYHRFGAGLNVFRSCQRIADGLEEAMDKAREDGLLKVLSSRHHRVHIAIINDGTCNLEIYHSRGTDLIEIPLGFNLRFEGNLGEVVNQFIEAGKDMTAIMADPRFEGMYRTCMFQGKVRPVLKNIVGDPVLSW